MRSTPLLLALVSSCGVAREIETPESAVDLPEAYRMLFVPGTQRFEGNVTRELRNAPSCDEDDACDVRTPITVVCTIDEVTREGAAMRSTLRCETEPNIDIAPGALPSVTLLGTRTALHDAILVDGAGATAEQTLWMQAEPQPHERSWRDVDQDGAAIGGGFQLKTEGRDWIIEESGWGPGRHDDVAQIRLRPGVGLVGGHDDATAPDQTVEIEWGEVE